MKKVITLAALIINTLVMASLPALAQETPIDKLQKVGQNVDAFKNQNDSSLIFSQLGSIVAIFLSILGILFVILFIYGGFIWMNSRGKEDEVERSKMILRAAIIGLIITLLAFAISNFIFSSILNASQLNAT